MLVMRALAVLLLAVSCAKEPTSSLDAAAPDAFADAAADAAIDAGSPDATAPDATPIDAGFVDAGTFPTGPIAAPPGVWTWVDFPQSRCMNDTPSGIGVNLASTSTSVLIFLMGGNACFNQVTCIITANTDGYGEPKFRNERGLTSSAFDRSAPENPFRDYNFVFVPYCTGDVFSGTKGDGEVRGTRWNFTGYRNIGYFLERLVPTFPDATDVVLAGVSAGGFGAMLNFDRTQEAFGPNVRVMLLNDSGAPLGSDYLAPCLQRHFADTWGMREGPLAPCAECQSAADGRFIEPYAEYLKRRYTDRSLALITSEHDSTIRGFYGFGNDDCRNINQLFLPTYDAARFAMGLADLRDRVFGGADNFRVFMPPGERHVWLTTPPWRTVVDGVTLADWISQGIARDPAWRHVP